MAVTAGGSSKQCRSLAKNPLASKFLQIRHQELGLRHGIRHVPGDQSLKRGSDVLGLFADSGVPAGTASLVSNNPGVPGTELVVSNAVSVGAQAKYTFGLSSYQLAANTSYWIVPQPDVSWHVSQPVAALIGQNSSGYAYLGSAQKTLESANTWTRPFPSPRRLLWGSPGSLASWSSWA